ncbi:gliding motility-associated C-terminal domain-containing protein [uncultured Capnocytophaga sp.]|uniref:T9SS type B sorting domain-containing protein n=1 Tax=uncultured Capnocytophaga sp. TaxID=159273 RepID=UPI00259A6DEA|nr:gliding motility-associated C-terminal domain-containing protein [uncultured Capnocytophaga sp.]
MIQKLKNGTFKGLLIALLMVLALATNDIYAQTCDPNTQKALKETHVSYFDKVTQGATATFTIKYPLQGTTYIFSDNLGATYSYTYTATGQDFVYINVGAVNTTRRFALKAINGGCTYQTGFDYTINPVTTLQLAYRVEHEWCGSSGAIRFTLVGPGADNSQYNFFCKKKDETSYGAPRSLSGAISLEAGIYNLIAVRGGVTITTNPVDIKVDKDIKTIAFTTTQLPATCASSGLGIKVNVTQANYPVYYTLKDNAGVDIPGKVKQTSNVFTGLAPGTYFVKVENFCGRYENPQPITINSSSFSITHVSTYIKPREYNCDYVDFFRLWFMGTSVTDAYNSNAFSYPFTFKVLLTSPSGKHYTPTYTITNKEDFDTYLSLLPGWGGEGFTIANSLREHRIAKEYGTWQIGAELDMCGVITTYPAVSSDLYNPIENVQTEIDTGGNDPSSCHTTQLRIRYRDGYSREDTPTLDTYLVVDTAPSGFDYAGAGFYQLGTTTNTLLQGKYLKAIRYNSDSFITVVEPRFLRNGDTFRFRLVDATCSSTRSYLMPAVTVNNANPQATNLGVYESGSCDGFTLTGTTKGSIHIIRNYGSPITQIKIVRYNGSDTGNIGSTSLALPYMLNASHHEKENNWYVRDLPFGNYSLTVTNACGKTITPSVTLKGQTYSVTFLPGCEPTVSATIGDYRAYNTDGQDTSFVIQRYDESRQEWIEFVRPRMNFGTYTTKTSDWGLGKKGKFRVIRRVNDSDGNNICVQVLAEKEFKGDLEEPKIVGFGCSNGKYHLVVIPQGGTPSYTYELVHRVDSGLGVTIPINQVQSGDSFFLDLDVNNPNDAYKFKVTDSCPSAKEREITIANVRTPTIEANQRFYCVGQSAQLTVPDLGPNVTIEWYRSDDAPGTFRGTGTTYTIAALAADDFLHTYKVRLKIPSKTVVQGCISDAIQPYQFQDPAVVIPSISPTNAETIKCVEANEDFDIMSIFNIPSMTLPANVTTRVVETTGEIPVMSNDKIKIRYQAPYQRPMGWGTHTFRYEILYPCGTVATHQEAKLTVKPYVNYKPKDVVKICNPNVTLNEVKKLITEGTPTITTIQPEFHWYTSYANAVAESSELPGSTSLDTSNGKTEVRYLRFSKAAYCSTKVYTITIQGEQAVTNKTLSNNGCDITTIASLKALVDPVDAAKVVIYKDGVEQADNALVETNTGYRYAKNVYECVTESATLSFNLSNRLQAKNELVKVCTSLGYRNNLVTTAGNVKDALGAIYTDTSLTIKLYNKREATSADEYTNNDSEVYTYTDLYFKLQKPSWCDSMVYSVRWAQSTITLAETKSITICEEVTVGELADQLQTAYNYQDVYIYKNDENRPLGTNVFVDWNSALYFNTKEPGKCRSIKVPLVLIKNTNVTTATAKAFVVCRMPSETPKVSALKSVISGGDVRIFIRNNNQWYLQADTDNVNTGYSYFYTLQATGKCPSEKTPLIVNLLDRPTTTPTVSATVTLCPTATSTVVSLTTYVAPLAGHTLQWYDTATATTTRTVPTINTHVTTKTTVSGYVVYVNSNGCESPRAVVTVTVDDTATPTLTAPAPLVIDCKNATASITEWLGTATATDSCGTVSITNNYNAVKPANLCNHSGVVTVTFTATDLFGNAVSETRTITLAHIKANTDSVTIANGANGGSSTITVFDNDKIGTQTATASTVSMTVTTPATGAAGSATPTLNADGTVTVPAGTKSGTYTIGYKICADVVSITVCDNATITIVVGQASLSVVSETFTISNGANGGTTSSVLENDNYNGTIGLAGNASVTLTWTNVPTGIQTHTDGTITIPAGTRSGTYEVGYKLCENLNNNHCAVATATIVVGQAPLQATDNDYVISNGANGGTTSSVLEDDSYNGTTGLVGNASVTLTWDSVPTGIQTHTNGTITVPAGTPSGIYTLTYHICENLNSSNCSAATVTIAVGVSLIVAHNDNGASFSIPNGANGGTTSSVLANDTLNGNANPSTSSVTLTWTNVPTGIQTNTDGTITAPAGTPAGTYTLTYRICEQLNGTNCSAATVTLVVGQASLSVVSETFTISNGANGGTTSSVLENDNYNGTTNLVGNASVTLTWTNVPAGVQTHTDGTITIPAGTRSGTYEVGYQLCENLNGSNCSVATATIVVGQADIIARNNTYAIANGAIGGTTSNVLENDTYNGVRNIVGNTSVTLTWDTVPAGISTPTGGAITIPAGTPSGIYTFTYTICEVLNSNNCSSATATVAVGVSLIVAEEDNDDTFKITNGANGGTTSSVLANDTLNGVTPPNTASITLHWHNVPTGIRTNTDGTITVPAGTASGTYIVTYSICEALNPTNCSGIATATIVVGQASLTAAADTFTVTNVAGGTTSSVLANDSYNGVTPPNTASVTLTWLTVPAGVQTHTDGTITIPAGMTSGTYQISYQLCENINSTNCSVATATIVVTSVSSPTATPTITANADTFTLTVSSTTYTTTSNVLTNDRIGTATATVGSVTIQTTPPATDKPYIDANTGFVVIPSGVATGTYTINYSLCGIAPLTGCSSVTTVTVNVTSVTATPTTPINIIAVPDGTVNINAETGGHIASVLANDTLEGQPVTTGTVSFTWTTATPTGFTLNSDGTIDVASNTTVGFYTISYTICATRGSDRACATSLINVNVVTPTATPTIEVNGETFTYTGNMVVGNVLTNDKLNNISNPLVTSVTLTAPVPETGKPYIKLTSGEVMVLPGTPAGSYEIPYNVCVPATTICGTATVVVIVPAATPTPVPVAADDEATTVRNTPVTIAVLANDTPHGAMPNVVTVPLNGTTTVKPDGTIEYTPNSSFIGNDAFVYELCNNNGACVTATVRIKVENNLIVYNGVSVDGNDRNRHFHIAGIENYPKNVVRIFNRWGIQVFEVEGYDNVRNVFTGRSDGRVTIEAGDKLPQGTYYYTIEYVDENNQKQKQAGWLYLKRN